jgi:membrane protein YqaA with SNARE-associated domain
MYNWVVGWAEKPSAEKALGGLSFAESSFFPIPPDPLIIAMVTARPKKWFRIASIGVIGSVLGGIAGYVIGMFLFATLGQWIIDTYSLQAQYESAAQLFRDHAFLAVLIGGFTPIPYKLVAIAAGAAPVSLPIFIIASILSRGGRFYLVAFLMHHFGKRYKDKIEKYIDGLGFLFILLVIIGFVAIKYIF